MSTNVLKRWAGAVTAKQTILLSCLATFMFTLSNLPRNRLLSTDKSVLSDLLRQYSPYMCKQTIPYSTYKFNISFIVCFQDPKYDSMFASYFFLNGDEAIFGSTYARGVRYEEEIVDDWLEALHNYPEAVVLDIGSNFGGYTLASRAMGNQVIAVDGQPKTHALLYNSLVLGGLDHGVTQVLNIVSNDHSRYKSHKGEINGDTWLFSQADSTDQIEKNPSSVDSVTFLELLELVPEDKPVMVKIDVEGYECDALREFLKLREKPRFVPYILMEVYLHCKEDAKSTCASTFKTEFLPLLESSGYIPHIPQPITYEELKERCYSDIFFAHTSAKPFNHQRDRSIYSKIETYNRIY